MQPQSCSDVTLVYYRKRGEAQPMRMLLLMTDTPFIELFKTFEDNQQTHEVNSFMTNHQIKEQDLPCLVHEGRVYRGRVAPFLYICKRFDLESLLGTNADDKARVCEMLLKYSQQSRKQFTVLFNFVKDVTNAPEDLETLRRLAFGNAVNESQLMLQFFRCGFRTKGHFILGYFSILDILFYEMCFYTLGFFGKLDQVSPVIVQYTKKNCNKCCDNLLQLAQLIRTMRQFKEYFETLPKYSQHQQRLNCYPVIPTCFGQEMKAVLQNIWVGDPKMCL